MWDPGTEKKLRRKCVPGSQLVPTLSPRSMSSLPQHSTQEWAMHLTGWFKSWDVWSWPKCHEGVWIQCHFTEKLLFQTRSGIHYSPKWNKTVAVCAKMAAICLGDFNNHTLIRCYRWMPHLTHSFTFWKNQNHSNRYSAIFHVKWRAFNTVENIYMCP